MIHMFEQLTLGLEVSCMPGEPMSSPVLVLRGRVCSEILAVVPTTLQRITDMTYLAKTDWRIEPVYKVSVNRNIFSPTQNTQYHQQRVEQA